MNRNSLGLYESRMQVKREGRSQKVFTVPSVGEVIVVNEHPMRRRDTYLKCDADNIFENSVSERFIGIVKCATRNLLVLDVKTPAGYKERAIMTSGFELEFYRYVVVDDSCLEREWTYDDLDLNGAKIANKTVSSQELVGIRKLG